MFQKAYQLHVSCKALPSCISTYTLKVYNTSKALHGKFYYDLLEAKESLARTDVALVRIEQLFPLPGRILQSLKKAAPTQNQ